MGQGGTSFSDVRPISRRSMIGGVAASIAGLMVISHGQAEEDSFRFGLTPVFLSDDLELLTRLSSYLAAAMDGPVELVTRRTYQEITAMLVSGQVHGAWICGYPYVQFQDELRLVAAPSWHGRPLYQSYMIATAGRPVSDWRETRGDIHAFSDPDSNSGCLVTQALLAQHDLEPANFFRRSFFTYGHRNVIRAVGAGLANSGSVDGYVWEVMRETEPELVAKTRVVRKSEWLGFPPIASSRALAGDPRLSRFHAALVEMGEVPAGREILDLLRLDAFVDVNADLFDPIAAKVELVRKN